MVTNNKSYKKGNITMLIFTICYTIMVPFIMVLIGVIWKKNWPSKINDFYGYRTSSSMKDKAHWDYAHQSCAKVMFMLGVIGLIITVPFIIQYFTLSLDEMANISMIPIMIHCALLVFSIIPVEIMIKRKFKKQ